MEPVEPLLRLPKGGVVILQPGVDEFPFHELDAGFRLPELFLEVVDQALGLV